MPQQALGQQHLPGAEDTPPATVGGQRAAGQRREPPAVRQPEEGREAAVELLPAPWGDTQRGGASPLRRGATNSREEELHSTEEELQTAERRSYSGTAAAPLGRDTQRGGATHSREEECSSSSAQHREGAIHSRGEELNPWGETPDWLNWNNYEQIGTPT